ncbi:hypothetical protein K458DRAFT_394485 [Lentithecium fluviatile CBS 122367]|uniref:Zn(2)-C6 fungal-type domain-containing protein n=1 Tax=Lentithecium fluviatile CBS 122367 TaxID=1168545 RepID=A0A6G1ILL8_9PLEO|nr:hypothetical protein K458DRAFT_394485 [Lentithecium fluviatile CBS 122367]
MSESAHVFNVARTTASSTENAHGVVDAPSTLAEGSRRRQQPQQARQLLSCTKCRERKVKCDRVKPCSACCARGAPKECHFIAEGGDYAHIQQSYEIRKLRAENLRLKERLRACKIPIEDDESDPAASPDSHSGERPAGTAQKRRAARQRRFQGSEWSDSIYFGSPGLANVVVDWANMNLAPMSTQSLAHLMPRGPEMYTTNSPPPYPFATLFKATPDECIPELLSCLPAEEDLLEYLDFFEKRVHICAFPHVPMEITRSEVERFLSDPWHNAKMCPDMLALLFAALALGAQHSAWDKSGGRWNAETMKKEMDKGNVYIAAAMQALRMASFMHKPTLLGIQALIMIGPFLTNSGRFLDAWTLFGTTIRLAHSIGLHRDHKYLDPAPPTQRECSIRQTLWWWMLHMDQEYSMTLGRPLGISGRGDCRPPLELTTNPTMLRFGEFVNQFTLLARQILSSDCLTNARIDEFTDFLKGLLDTMPEMLQFDESWLDERKEIPEWPLGAMAAVFYCKTHTYLILLNRQRSEKQTAQPYSHQASPVAKTASSYFHPANPAAPCQSSPASPKASLRGRALVLSSSEDLLTVFLFFHARVPAALICWTMGQQAFNSCMILLLDAMEMGDLSRIGKVEKAYVVFLQLQNNGVHELATLAVERISWGLAELGRMKNQAGAGGRMQPVVSARHGLPGRDSDIQGAAKSEAMQTGVMHDTVMGNTGMLLLEDPGLQAFVPEAFAPLTWALGKGGQGHGQRQREYGGHLDDAKPTSSSIEGAQVAAARSSEQVQGVQGSAPGSAPSRYATFGTAPGHPSLEQPQGLKSPTSPLPTPTGLMAEQQRRPTEVSLNQLPPPYLRHHSYPSLHHNAFPPIAPFSSRQRDAGPMAGMLGSQDADRESALDEELNMAKAMPRFVASQPLLQTLPEFATGSTTAAQPNPNVHPSWAARPAVPMSSLSDPALNYSQHLAGRGQDVPAGTLHDMPMPRWQCTLPLNLSSANGESASTTADQMEVEGWRRFLGANSGAG